MGLLLRSTSPYGVLSDFTEKARSMAYTWCGRESVSSDVRLHKTLVLQVRISVNTIRCRGRQISLQFFEGRHKRE